MVNNTLKTCGVCGGKGGWKILANYWWETNWNECLYCGGLGFREEQEDDEENSVLLTYNSYKNKITDTLESFGQLISYDTTEHGKRLEISLLPSSKESFLQFVKAFLRFGYYNKNLDVSVNQVLYYEPTDGLYHYYWKLILVPNTMADLDGFVDLIRSWEEKHGGSSKGRTGNNSKS